MSLSSLKKKIVLGTVQLGLPYGINNSQGKPNQAEAFRILDFAHQHHIRLLDTADAYGDAVSVLGTYNKHYSNAHFEIINKFIDDGTLLSDKLEKSLCVLNRDHLYAYLFHRYNDYQAGKFREILRELKGQKKVQRIGVSVYSLEELNEVINDDDVDLIQIPLNPFDYSLQKKKLIKQAKEMGKEIHVRSVFLQGLLFKTPDQLTGNLKELYEPLRQFHSILARFNLNVRQGCLNYALHQGEIDHVLIGVETASQLRENMNSILTPFDEDIIKQMDSIVIPEPLLLNPSNWRP